MFLEILEKLGRKKVVLDRGVSHPRFDLAKPWMNRYYVLFRNRPRWFPFNILKISRSNISSPFINKGKMFIIKNNGIIKLN